jgi:hypothetical protein
VLVAELHGLGGAAGRVVLRVEVQHHGVPDVRLRRELHAASGQGFEFRESFVDDRRHGLFSRTSTLAGPRRGAFAEAGKSEL